MNASQVFTTEQVTRLVGLDPNKDGWRVIKFSQSREYGINPSVSKATGSGTRRLYDLEDVCEIALALRLLETGLRSSAIGDALRRLRQAEPKGLSSKLNSGWFADDPWFVMTFQPRPGAPLKKGRVHFIGLFERFSELDDFLDEIRQSEENLVESALLAVPIGSMFRAVEQRLREQ